ncbi:sulfurtransferase TusA family protein [Rhizobium mayense]|uniref:Sulfurtransferase TusA family protein n=1 Tax=Rhizobium mayense TaxID=1312184 RepID=A0ABT7K3M6_9HYPH|nr:sulfurtransferase TusA family protein [Rhizobium mayense]MDL2403210.1 sulfurtransferase TusA family protein [Rhizobium mayense]
MDDRVYDLRGLKCPLPVLKTEKRLRGMPSGAILTVETSDPLAIIDIPHFCSKNGHTLVATEKTESGHRFIIRKR